MVSSHKAISAHVFVLAIVVQNGQVLLVKEARHGRGTWYLPAGRKRLGESVLDAVVREVREESGLEVLPQALLRVDQAFDAVSGTEKLRFLVLADHVGGNLKTEPDRDSLEAQWFMPHDLKNLPLRNPEVIDLVQHYMTGGPWLAVDHGFLVLR